MNRRQLIQLSLMASIASASQVQAAPKARKGAGGSPKKGIGGGGKFIEELKCKWFYNWTPRVSDGAPKGVQFIPMIKKYDGNEQLVAIAENSAKSSKANELLCFNEPDQKKQGDMTVQEALDAWPLLQKTKLRLGSPACVHPDNEWMKSFMAQAKKLDLKVDFVCVHSYGAPNAAAFINRLEAIHKLYKKPIWITEFAVGDWSAKSPAENQHKPDVILDYMKDVLPELDKLNFLERYAWFPASATSAPLGTSALWDAADKLTPLGEYYSEC